MTPKQQRFCEEYLVDLNGAQAAIRAGYSEKTARIIATQNLSKLNIQTKIQELQRELSEKTEITKQEILSQLAIVLRADIREYVKFDGKRLEFKSFDELTDIQAKAIESIKQTANGFELKLHGKMWSIDRICKMLGYDDPASLNINLNKLSDEELDLIIGKILNNEKE